MCIISAPLAMSCHFKSISIAWIDFEIMTKIFAYKFFNPYHFCASLIKYCSNSLSLVVKARSMLLMRLYIRTCSRFTLLVSSVDISDTAPNKQSNMSITYSQDVLIAFWFLFIILSNRYVAVKYIKTAFFSSSEAS